MKAWAVVAVSVAFAVAAAPACGDTFNASGSDDGGDDNPGINPGDATTEEASGDSSGGNDSGHDGTSLEGSADAPGEATELDGCTPQQPDAANGVFVSPGGIAAGCGSEMAPCTTIQKAIDVAAMNGRTWVYVDTGNYVEQLTLSAGITVQGGWTDLGGNWSRQCLSNRSSSVNVQAPSSANVTVLATYSGASTLDTLTVQSKAQGSVAASESIYGVFATGAPTMLTLTDVNVSVVNGGDGSTGAMGMTGQAGSMTGCNPFANGAVGSDGTAGPGGMSSYDIAGFHRGDGQTGMSGGPGGNGTAAGMWSCNNNACAGCTCSVPCGGSNYCCDDVNPVCGPPGYPGCGGQGGTGGNGATGGGASIGVFAWAATVTITAGSYTSGNGGGGGKGGGGGGGGAGVAAPPQGSTPDITGCHLMNASCILDHGSVKGGSPGGMGGNGGTGGPGGGGAGGDSYCYYSGGSANVNATGWSCTPGQFGAGGTANGANGNAGMHN